VGQGQPSTTNVIRNVAAPGQGVLSCCDIPQ
jgi:hypothetical protein